MSQEGIFFPVGIKGNVSVTCEIQKDLFFQRDFPGGTSLQGYDVVVMR